MSARLRHWLFLIAWGMLYLGPLMAGLAGFGWALVAVFAALFLVWPLVVLRRRDRGLSLAAQAVVQGALVVLCFAIGRGLGGVHALHPPLGPALPLALSVLALALGRAARPPKEVGNG